MIKRAVQLVCDSARGLRRHPLRAALIFLTYLVGFASVAGTIATVEGGRRSIQSDLNHLGMDVIAIFQPMKMNLLSLFSQDKPIEEAQVRALAAELGDSARQVLAGRIEPVHLEADSAHSLVTTLIGTEPGYQDILHAGILAGRFFMPGEMQVDGEIPAVLDEALARRFEKEDPSALVGRSLTLTRGGIKARARVLGIMRDPILLRRHLDLYDAESPARRVTARRLEFRNIYVPFRPGVDPITGVVVQVRDLANTDAIAGQVKNFFEQAEVPIFCFVQKRWIERIISIVDRFQFASHFIWILNLVVIMVLTGTITLVAVEERFFEAALRRAEGARGSEVVLPILGEGAFLAACALPFGIMLSWVVMQEVIVPVLGWEPNLPSAMLCWIAPVLIGTGVLANLLPAWRVARLHPARILSERTQL